MDIKSEIAKHEEEIKRLKEEEKARHVQEMHELLLKQMEEEKAFKNKLAEEYDVVGNPKFEKAYSLAYSYGHANGYESVENYFDELVDLIK